MGLIEELIALNKAKAAGVEPGDTGTSALRPLPLTQTEHRRRQRLKKRKGLDWALVEVTERFAKNQRGALLSADRGAPWRKWRKEQQRKATDREAERLRQPHRRDAGCGGRVWELFGTVDPAAQWVGLIALMEPGRWYGIRVLEQLAGRRKPLYVGNGIATRMFVERGLNPNHRPERDGPGMVSGTVRRIGPIEPRYLWRLNRWGVALRTAVLDELTGKRINVLELDGAASPEIWKSRGGRQKRYSRKTVRP